MAENESQNPEEVEGTTDLQESGNEDSASENEVGATDQSGDTGESYSDSSRGPDVMSNW